MPDDLSDLISELGGTSEEEETTTEEEEITEEETAEEEEETVEEPEVKPSEDKTDKAFAAMRAANSKYEKFFKKLKEATGTDEETFMKTILQEATASKAKEMNISPELLSKIQEQEDRLKAYEQREKEKTFMLALDSLQREFKLDGKDVEEFVRTSVEKGVDLFNSQLDLQTIFKAMNHDKLVSEAVEKARQEFIKTQTKADKASVPDDSKGKGSDKGVEVIETMSDLDKLLSSMKK